jgi:hypothetical protein
MPIADTGKTSRGYESAQAGNASAGTEINSSDPASAPFHHTASRLRPELQFDQLPSMRF